MASFATEVKNELARLSVEKETDRTAELAGLLRMSAAILFGRQGRFGGSLCLPQPGPVIEVKTGGNDRKPQHHRKERGQPAAAATGIDLPPVGIKIRHWVLPWMV